MSDERTCALCGDLIEDGQAWLVDDAAPATLAHSGCVYGDGGTEPARWRPAEVGTEG